MGYPWPGNVRELQNVVNQGVLLSASDQIELSQVDYPGSGRQPLQRRGFDPKQDESLQSYVRQITQEAEKSVIGKILGECDFNQSKAAAILGITRKTLAKKIQQLQIRKP